jgi:hypothetical protein
MFIALERQALSGNTVEIGDTGSETLPIRQGLFRYARISNS